MSHGKHTDNLTTRVETEYLNTEFHVCPQASVSKHDTFGAAGGSGGIVNQCQFIQVVVSVLYVVGCEAVGVFFPENLRK